MRILCPHCQKSVAVPDAAAGQATPCPLCGHIFTPPALAGAALDLPPAPAINPGRPMVEPPAAPAPFGSVGAGTVAPAAPPPASKPVAATVSAPAPAPAPSTGQLPCCRLILRHDVVRWLAPAGLVLAFILTFFPWVAAAPGGYTVYTQSAWQVAFGGTFNNDHDLLKKADALERHRGVGWVMVFYLLGLLLTTALAIGDKFVPETLVVPDVLKGVWAQRRVIVSALCIVLFLLLVIECLAGFGLESAAAGVAEEAVVPPLNQGTAGAVVAKHVRDINSAIELNSFGLRRTWWWTLAVLAQLTAAAGIGLSQWLDRRGLKAEPHVDFYG